MRRALAIAAKDLRLRSRDRSAYLIGFLVPLGLAWILSLTLADVDEGELAVRMTVVNLDGGEVADAFEDVVVSIDIVELVAATSAGEAERLAEDGEIDAAVVLPEGFTEAATSAGGSEIVVLASPDSDVGGLIARSIARSFVADLDGVRLAVAAAVEAGAPPEETAALVDRARAVPAAVDVARDAASSDRPSTSTFFAIAMAVFFLFFTVEFGVRSLLDEREAGTLARLLVAPLGAVWIVVGKVVAGFVVGVASMAALVAASTVFMGAEWGAPVGVALIVLAGVASGVAVTAFVSTLAASPAQAAGYTSLVAVVLGLLGGTFFPISQGPAVLATLSLLTPHAWMMRGFQELAGGGTVADALPAVGALLVFAAAAAALAVSRSRKLIAR
jgi:ABC-2 type transport system permease protein